MRRSLAAIVCVVVAGMMVSTPLSSATAQTTIYKYEKKGGKSVKRLEGQKKGTTRDKKKDSGATRSSSAPSRAAPAAAPTRGGATVDRPPPAERFEPGEVVVSNAPKGFARSVRGLGFSVLERVSLKELSVEIFRLRIPRASSVGQALKLLKRQFPGLEIDANHQFDLSAGSRIPESYVRAAIGWKTPAKCRAKVRIGMIDSALDMSHPALKGRNIAYKSFHDPKRKPGQPDHGTAIAAMIIGKPGKKGWGGLIEGAKLFAANMFEINENGKSVGNAMGLIKSINWMAKQKVHAVNVSVAGANNKVVRLAFMWAHRKGLLVIAAAGNWGKGAEPAYPAAYKDVVAVTAVGSRMRIYRKANRGKYIDFAAPGVKIWTAVPGGGRVQSGTSFAVPHITTMMALEVARGSGKKAGTLRKVLRKRAVDLGKPGRDKVFGWGYVKRKPKCA
ncbi:MAG TPA: S8 family serine peptidase [Alphaproteobacteria bacterium]|nr:S8 family serine peptidase [Alphaproteobacteria bacterium]